MKRTVKIWMNVTMNKIKQFFFCKNNEFSWIKSAQTVLLLYITPNLTWLYYNELYTPSFKRVAFNCFDCGSSVFFAGILCYKVTFIILILSFANYFHSNKRNINILKYSIKTILFACVLASSFFILNTCGNPICFLNILAFPPLALSFIFIFRKTKYFSHFFIILFLIPASILITDELTVASSHKDCKQDLLKVNFFPATLPINYFHKNATTGELSPNVVLSVDVKKEYNNKILFIGYPYCGLNGRKTFEKYIKNNIILCYYKSYDSFTISLLGKNTNILAELKFTKFNRKRNDLDLILGTTKGKYSCAEKFSENFLIEYLPYTKYLNPAYN